MTHEHRLHAGTFEDFWRPYCEAHPKGPIVDYDVEAAFNAGRTPADAALSDITARKAVLIEAYGFTEQTETEGATEIDDGWDAATMRGWGEWAAIISLEDILKGER